MNSLISGDDQSIKEYATPARFGTEAALFGFVGIANNALLYLAYLLLTLADVNVMIAMTTVFFAGVLFSWSLNARLTFKRPLTSASAKRMTVAYSLAYALNSMCLWVSHFVLELPHEASQGVIMLLLAIVLFFVQRHWVFGCD